MYRNTKTIKGVTAPKDVSFHAHTHTHTHTHIWWLRSTLFSMWSLYKTGSVFLPVRSVRPVQRLLSSWLYPIININNPHNLVSIVTINYPSWLVSMVIIKHPPWAGSVINFNDPLCPLSGINMRSPRYALPNGDIKWMVSMIDTQPRGST